MVGGIPPNKKLDLRRKLLLPIHVKSDPKYNCELQHHSYQIFPPVAVLLLPAGRLLPDQKLNHEAVLSAFVVNRPLCRRTYAPHQL